jgi:gluconate 2-dehydrogenase alpha chain
MYSKASPNVNILPALRQTPLFELRNNAWVLRVNLSRDKKTATGVSYIDAKGNELEQPAELVVISAFQLHNVHLMLLSGIGAPYDPESNKGVIGRNFSYQVMSVIRGFFGKHVHTNPFIGAGAAKVGVDDFNADNFDHGPLGFVGGGPLWIQQAGNKPISGVPTLPGAPAWGGKWKAAVAESYNHFLSMEAHGVNCSYRVNHMDLDPTYKNVHGQPLLRLTFDWQDNDIRMNQYLHAQMAKIVKAMKPEHISGEARHFGEHYNTVPYQTTHLNGGVVMGESPETSALNRYLQSWDVPNVFVPGASAFPQALGYNPTGLLAALTYWSAKAIRDNYLKKPGALIQA